MTYDRIRALSRVGLESIYNEWRHAEHIAAARPCPEYQKDLIYRKGAVYGALAVLAESGIFTDEELLEWRKEHCV